MSVKTQHKHNMYLCTVK